MNITKHKTKILFLDDEKNILDVIQRIIHKELKAWDAVFLTDSIQARDRILNEKFDVVVSDIRMPGLDGLSLLNEIKQAYGFDSPEFIIVTGEGDVDLKQKALNLDATDLLNKPIRKEELLARIRSSIRVKESKEEVLQKNKLLEEQLIQSQKMELIGMMASGAAHDFKNILTVILMSLELAQLQSEMGPNIIKYIKRIQKAAGHGQQITSQILNFIKKKEFELGPVLLNQLVDETVDLLHTALPKGVKIIWDNSDEDNSINADYTQIFQIIMNLCLNASNAMQGPGIITITLSEKNITSPVNFFQNKVHAGKYACITVSDNGPGMDNGLIRDLQDNPFSIKSSQSGTGLGLAITARCIINHSGFFEIESSKNNGTLFKLYLPK